MAGRLPKRAARQPAGLHLSSQRAPLWGKAHVWPGGFGLPDFSPWSPSQASRPELAGGVGPLGPKQLSVRTVAEQIRLLVSESRCERGHPKHWGQAGAAHWPYRQVDNWSGFFFFLYDIFSRATRALTKRKDLWLTCYLSCSFLGLHLRFPPWRLLQSPCTAATLLPLWATSGQPSPPCCQLKSLRALAVSIVSSVTWGPSSQTWGSYSMIVVRCFFESFMFCICS